MAGQLIDIATTPAGALRGYLAAPTGAPMRAILLLQEIFGVNAGLRAVADHLARDGALVLAPDLFWREAPGVQLDPGREEDRQRAVALMGGLDDDLALQDVGAAKARLQELGGEDLPVGAIGFCLGGRLAYLAGRRGLVAAAVSYYGVAIHRQLTDEPALSPVLLHIAEDDHLCPPEAQATLRAALGARPDRFVLQTHPGVGHAFARRGGPAFDAAATALAELQTRAFLDEHLGR